MATNLRKVTPKSAQVVLQGDPWTPKPHQKCTLGTQNVQGTPPKALGVPTQAQNVSEITLNRQNGREFASNQKQKFGEGYRVAQGKKDKWALYFMYLLGSFCCSDCGEWGACKCAPSLETLSGCKGEYSLGNQRRI